MYIKFKKLLMIVAGFFLCLILVPRAQHQSPPTKLSTFIVYKLPVLSITLIHDLLIKKTPLNLPTGIAIFIFFVYQEPIDCGEKNHRQYSRRIFAKRSRSNYSSTIRL